MRSWIFGQKTKFDTGLRKCALTIKAPTAWSVHVTSGAETARDLKNSILAAKKFEISSDSSE